MYLYSASAIMMAALIVVCAGVPDPSAEQADIFRAAGLPLPKFLHGVREPDATFQKSREEVFNDDATPFSDWYYVYVRDVKTRERWAFTYAMSRCSKSMPQAPPCSYSGAWPSVVVMRPGHPALSYAERHPLSAWSASAVSQDAKIVGGNSSYSIRATTPDGDHIRLVGDMASPSLAWPVAKGAQLAKGGISWDLTVSRRAGWFGESWIEGMDLGRLTGAIMWSPYAHQSTVSRAASPSEARRPTSEATSADSVPTPTPTGARRCRGLRRSRQTRGPTPGGDTTRRSRTRIPRSTRPSSAEPVGPL